MTTSRAVTVVIPIFNHAEGTLRCIESCKEHIDPRHTVLLLNDASTDPTLEDRILHSIKGFPSFRYERNAENLGFVKSCNRAVFELDTTDHDILLLNSDTVVTPGFLEEMIACLHADDTHAVCCPHSDDATLLTFPRLFCDFIPKEERYALWRTVHHRLPPFSALPTGVGFCMLIRRSVIRHYGLFDEVYGHGYNEENDFCARIAKDGWKILVAHHAFVCHDVHGSFQKEKAAQLHEKNKAILNERYPEFEKHLASALPVMTLQMDVCVVQLHAETGELRAQNALLQQANSSLHQEIQLLHDELAWMRRSRSWRITSPLRALLNRLQAPRPSRNTVQSAPDTSQAGEVALLRSLLPQNGPRILVDVGAHDGAFLSNSLPFIQEGWEAVLIEPHPALFAKLAERHSGNHRVRCLQKACGDAPGRLPLYVSKDAHLSMSTLCTDDTPWFREHRGTEIIEVEVEALTDILAAQHVPNNFPLLLIDAEGMDYEVLLGLDPERFRPHVILTEEYEGNAEKHRAKYELLSRRGYRLHAKVGCNTVWVAD